MNKSHVLELNLLANLTIWPVGDWVWFTNEDIIKSILKVKSNMIQVCFCHPKGCKGAFLRVIGITI